MKLCEMSPCPRQAKWIVAATGMEPVYACDDCRSVLTDHAFEHRIAFAVVPFNQEDDSGT